MEFQEIVLAVLLFYHCLFLLKIVNILVKFVKYHKNAFTV